MARPSKVCVGSAYIGMSSHIVVREIKSYALHQLGLKELIACQKHIIHCNCISVLRLFSIAYLNPEGDFLFLTRQCSNTVFVHKKLCNVKKSHKMEAIRRLQLLNDKLWLFNYNITNIAYCKLYFDFHTVHLCILHKTLTWHAGGCL